MKLGTLLACSCMLAGLTACGGDEKTTVVHERPVVIQQAPSSMTPADVERTCAHGYDNRTRSCY